MKINFAHRGSLTEAPENTVAAMKKALDNGALALELDVQLSKDGELVVIHDQHFKRLNKKVKEKVKDLSLAEIKQIDIGSSFSRKWRNTKIATLAEILEAIPSNTFLNVEIKNIPIVYEGIEEKVIATLEAYDRLEHTMISSFDHEALVKVQEINKDIRLGMLFYYRIVKPWKYVEETDLKLFSVHPLFTTIDREFVEQFHRMGLKVYPFTVDTMANYDAMMGLGVDGVFSNNPEIFGKKRKEEGD